MFTNDNTIYLVILSEGSDTFLVCYNCHKRKLFLLICPFCLVRKQTSFYCFNMPSNSVECVKVNKIIWVNHIHFFLFSLGGGGISPYMQSELIFYSSADAST